MADRNGADTEPIKTAITDQDGIDLSIIELLFFAYRDFTGDPDAVLEQYGFGRAHHRVLHFVNRNPGLRVANLLDILKITKQSLARVLNMPDVKERMAAIAFELAPTTPEEYERQHYEGGNIGHRPGLKGADLLKAVAESDALITRSGTARGSSVISRSHESPGGAPGTVEHVKLTSAWPGARRPEGT